MQLTNTGKSIPNSVSTRLPNNSFPQNAGTILSTFYGLSEKGSAFLYPYMIPLGAQNSNEQICSKSVQFYGSVGNVISIKNNTYNYPVITNLQAPYCGFTYYSFNNNIWTYFPFNNALAGAPFCGSVLCPDGLNLSLTGITFIQPSAFVMSVQTQSQTSRNYLTVDKFNMNYFSSTGSVVEDIQVFGINSYNVNFESGQPLVSTHVKGDGSSYYTTSIYFGTVDYGTTNRSIHKKTLYPTQTLPPLNTVPADSNVSAIYSFTGRFIDPVDNFAIQIFPVQQTPLQGSPITATGIGFTGVNGYNGTSPPKLTSQPFYYPTTIDVKTPGKLQAVFTSSVVSTGPFVVESPGAAPPVSAKGLDPGYQYFSVNNPLYQINSYTGTSPDVTMYGSTIVQYPSSNGVQPFYIPDQVVQSYPEGSNYYWATASIAIEGGMKPFVAINPSVASLSIKLLQERETY